MKKPLSEIAESIPKYVSTPEIRVECSEEEKFPLVQKLKENFQKDFQSIDIDGVRVLFDEGWALMRASNTQPVIVFRFEAKTEKAMEDIKKLVKGRIAKYSSIEISF